VLIDALLDTDGPAAARAAADRYGFVPVGDIDKAASQHLQLALARVSLAERRPETVLAELASCHRWEQEFGRCSVAFAPWRPIAIRARLMLGDQAGAGELAEQLLELSDRFGEGTIRGAARHASALVRADPDLMREAIELLAGSPIRQAEALLDLSLLARARRRLPEARTAMEDALAKAAGAGAGALVERIRVELRASGGRPRRAGAAGVAALTPAELRVVRQAAAGRSNREIAQAVFLSPRTVEMHLSNAYRKLGITERSRLADLIGQLD
jgi:DNA-binding CsgD family transcriptional regulator